jgi:hypothetical protein
VLTRRAFSTELVDKARQREREEREKLRLAYIQRVVQALDALSDFAPFEEAYIFGSLVRAGSFRPGISDIDIAIVGLRDEDFFRAASFLSKELGLEIDLVQLESHRLEHEIREEGLKWKKGG